MLKKPKFNFSPVPDYSTTQLTFLVILRLLIGWHFFYEGFVKLFNPYWSSAGFLLETQGIFKGLASSIVASPAALRVVDFLNVWGLILIGAGLILGCLTRAATLSGIFLLFLYYVFHPPLIGYTYATPVEGSYLIVNKILIETFALLVLLVFPTGGIIGIDRLIFRAKKTNKKRKK
ncbi:MAG: DoxX family membrane protein [Candidatus Aminicenantes bacterium]|nr:DoxX family membrane protein [Candidatus Aminicenantes bacterium]